MLVRLVMVVSFLLQLSAACLALRLIRITSQRRTWVVIAMAISLMALRRGITLFQVATGLPTVSLDFVEESITLLSSTLMLVGVAYLGPMFKATKQDHESLRLNEGRLRDLYESAPCGYLSVDREGVIGRCNHRAEQILGYASGALLGIPVSGLLLDLNIAHGKTAVAHDHLWDGGPLTDLEVQMCTADARAIWVSLSILPVFNASGTIVEFRAIIVDISERIKAAEELYLMQHAVDRAGEGVVWVRPDGRFVYANDAYCEMFGRSRDELLTMHVWDVTPRMPEAGWPTHWDDARDHGTLTIESEGLRPDGTLFPVAVTINFVALADRSFMFTFVRDVSERQRVQERLELTQFVVDHAGESIFLMDRDGCFTFVNDAACDRLGYSREELLLMSVFDIDPDFSREAWQQCWEALKAGKPHLIESVHRTKDGRVFPIEINANHVILGGQEFDCAFVRDISERRRVAEQLQRQLDELQSIHNLSEAVSRADALDSVYDEAINALIRTFGVDRAAILLSDPDGVMRFKAWKGLSDGYRRMVEGHSPWSPDATDPQPILIPDVDTDPGQSPLKSVVLAEGIHALAFFPLVCDRRLQGKFMLYYDQSHVFTEEEIRLARTMAGHVAFAIGRMRAEDALRESEARFRQLAESTNQVFWLTDWDTKRLLYVNAAYERLYERSCQSAYEDRRSWLDVVHPEDRPRIEEVFTRNACLGCDAEGEYRIVLADGTVRWVLDRSFPIRDDNGRVYRFASVAEDITERKQAEEELKIKEEEYRRLFEANPHPMLLCDMETLSFMEVNEAAIQIYGYSREEFTSLKATQIRPPEDIPFLMERVAATETGFNHVGVTRHCKKDGTVIDVELTSYCLTWQGRRANLVLVLDVTERKRAQDALHDALARFEAVIDQTPLVGVQSLSREGVIQRWNPACETLYGYPAADAIGKSLQDLIFSGHEAVDFEDTLRRVWDEGRPSPPRERAAHSSDGTPRVVYSSMFPIRHDGKVAEVIRMDVDITDRKRTEEQLLQAKRLEAAGQLAGQIAHDFNNLLGPLIAYPELIAKHLDGEPRMRDMLRDMEDAATQIAEINQELLTMSRRGHYNLEPVDLNRLFDDALRMLNLPDRISVHKTFHDPLPLVRGGPSQVMRTVANLISNATDAMPDSGTLSLQTGLVRLDGPLRRYPDVVPGDYVRVDIKDTGRGVAADAADRIFDPFFTTKKADKKRGSGLGLTVVHSVMEDHKGYVDFESVSGEGTTFSLFFPVTNAVVPDPEDTTTISRGNGERVLVVDDDSLQLRIAERTLRQLGYTVHTVSSGEDAVAFVTDHPQDVVLLDMVMDGIDGTETLRRIKKKYPDQIAIILSGFASSDRVDEALHMGAKGFIQKPVKLAKMAEVLHDALSGKRSAAPLPVA